MGKRSNFERIDKDFYRTFDPRAVEPLVEHINDKIIPITYAEPCYGTGDLVRNLEIQIPILICEWVSDIENRGNYRFFDVKDGLDLTDYDIINCDYIITNPPWERKLLHKLIIHFSNLRPTWLLFDSNWANTLQAEPYLERCEKIVQVGRVKWIPDSKHISMDDAAWYLFDKYHTGPTEFYGRKKRKR